MWSSLFRALEKSALNADWQVMALPRTCPRPSALSPVRAHGPNGGVPDSLDEAKTAFRAAWDQHCRYRMGLSGRSVRTDVPFLV